MAEVKETKAQRMERLKREKNPWEALDDVRAFAAAGRESVLPEWASAYFKWWGVYTQGDGAGALGGKGGEGKATEYFMMRIALPNGIATSEQIERDRRHRRQAWPRPGRHYRAPGHPAALAHHRSSARDHRAAAALPGCRPREPAATWCAMSPVARWRVWTADEFSMLRLSRSLRPVI